MSRRVIILVAGLLLFTVVGLVLAYVVRVRGLSDDQQCQKNMGEVALFAAHHAKPIPGVPADKLVHEIPAGTVVLPGVPPDERLSWYVRVLPGLDQKRQNTASILAGLDLDQPWGAEKNQMAARARLPTLLCPGNPPHGAATSYVGIAGLGADAPTLALPPVGPAPPRAGCFRYDAPTPFGAIADGLSQTFLMGERSADLGSWARGGPFTVRGLDDSPAAPPLLGPDGQFGGNHPNGANWAFADGSVRFFKDGTDRRVLLALATIAGKESDLMPGE
jgi:prepilin-type processing-associated H-X9-DG protein